MKNCLGFDQNSHIFYDKCSLDYRDKMSQQAGLYHLQTPSETRSSDASNLSLSQPNVNYQDGRGWTGRGGKLVDIDSKLRNGRNITHGKEVQQFTQKQYFNVPYLARGTGNPCVESVLWSGEDTGQRKPCNSFARETIMDQRFYTQVDELSHLQDPKHIVPETVSSGWVRGGQSSRQLLRNKDFLSGIGYHHNGKYWERPKSSK